MAEVTACVDAGFKLTISSDDLEVSLVLKSVQGSDTERLREDVLAKLSELGVVDGMRDVEAIDAAIASEAATGVVVARGRQVQHGKDGWLESLVPEARDRKLREDETGQVDYRDLGGIVTVRPGDQLILRHGPTEGTPGLTVLGKTIPAKLGKAMPFATSLTGTAPSADNPDLLLATISGQPVVVRGGAIVEPVIHMAAVNSASGNIDFDGTVVIKGDVSAGMKVHVTGDIRIGGVAEMATLEAGGSISIKGGALGSLGRKNAGDHYIRCGGNFTAAYTQQVRIEAGDSIFIEDLAMQCDLHAANHIKIGHQRRGHIIGGTLCATMSITGKVIGSPSRTRTRLEIGVNPGLKKQLLAITKVREAKETQLLEVSKLLAFAKKNSAKVPPEIAVKANATYDALSDEITALREECEQLGKKIALSQQSCVVVEQTIHEGAEVMMGNLLYKVIGEMGACSIGLIDGVLGLKSP